MGTSFDIKWRAARLLFPVVCSVIITSVSEDLLSVVLENHSLHHLFKLSVSFKSSKDEGRAQGQRKRKQEVCV